MPTAIPSYPIVIETLVFAIATPLWIASASALRLWSACFTSFVMRHVLQHFKQSNITNFSISGRNLSNCGFSVFCCRFHKPLIVISRLKLVVHLHAFINLIWAITKISEKKTFDVAMVALRKLMPYPSKTDWIVMVINFLSTKIWLVFQNFKIILYTK